MLSNLIIGICVTLIAIVIHGAAVLLLFNVGRSPLERAQHRSALSRLSVSCLLVTGLIVAHSLEILLWATVFRLTGALESFEEAVYFTAVSFATIGYGDITLSADWRLVGAFVGVNGILLFGWTTAFLFKVSEIMWRSQGRPSEKAV